MSSEPEEYTELEQMRDKIIQSGESFDDFLEDMKESEVRELHKFLSKLGLIE